MRGREEFLARVLLSAYLGNKGLFCSGDFHKRAPLLNIYTPIIYSLAVKETKANTNLVQKFKVCHLSSYCI